DGWMTFDDPDAFGITSVATFDGLLDGAGDKRYRLRFHAASLAKQKTDPPLAFAIGNQTTQPLTRIMAYHYFRAPDGGPPRVNVFCNDQGTSTFNAGWPLERLRDKDEVWYTLLFDKE